MLIAVEVIVNIESIEGGIGGAKRGTKSQPAFNPIHDWEKVGDITMVKGLGHFSQDELANIGYFRGSDTGGITPVILANTDLLTDRLAFFRWSLLVTAALKCLSKSNLVF